MKNSISEDSPFSGEKFDFDSMIDISMMKWLFQKNGNKIQKKIDGLSIDNGYNNPESIEEILLELYPFIGCLPKIPWRMEIQRIPETPMKLSNFDGNDLRYGQPRIYLDWLLQNGWLEVVNYNGGLTESGYLDSYLIVGVNYDRQSNYVSASISTWGSMFFPNIGAEPNVMLKIQFLFDILKLIATGEALYSNGKQLLTY